MTTRRHENLHFSRGFHPSPPNDGAKGEKSAYLSGNPTPSANCLCWRRGGGIVKSCLPSVLFWPSANGGVGGRHPFGRFSPEQNQSLGGSGIASLCEPGGPQRRA